MEATHGERELEDLSTLVVSPILAGCLSNVVYLPLASGRFLCTMTTSIFE